jgi:hypothetical protein
MIGERIAGSCEAVRQVAKSKPDSRRGGTYVGSSGPPRTPEAADSTTEPALRTAFDAPRFAAARLRPEVRAVGGAVTGASVGACAADVAGDAGAFVAAAFFAGAFVAAALAGAFFAGALVAAAFVAAAFFAGALVAGAFFVGAAATPTPGDASEAGAAPSSACRAWSWSCCATSTLLLPGIRTVPSRRRGW